MHLHTSARPSVRTKICVQLFFTYKGITTTFMHMVDLSVYHCKNPSIFSWGEFLRFMAPDIYSYRWKSRVRSASYTHNLTNTDVWPYCVVGVQQANQFLFESVSYGLMTPIYTYNKNLVCNFSYIHEGIITRLEQMVDLIV